MDEYDSKYNELLKYIITDFKRHDRGLINTNTVENNEVIIKDIKESYADKKELFYYKIGQLVGIYNESNHSKINTITNMYIIGKMLNLLDLENYF